MESKIKSLLLLVALSFSCLTYYSCSKVFDNNPGEYLSGLEGDAKIKVVTPIIHKETNISLEANNRISKENEEQKIDIGGGSFIIASLEKDVYNNKQYKIDKSASTNEGTTQTARDTIQQSLAKNTKYSIYIYSKKGDYIAHRDYVAGKENETKELLLSGNASYTFVAYSVNSKDTIPTVINSQSLSTASVENVSEDLMYVKWEQNILPAQENVILTQLKHQFSLVTTELRLTDAVGNELADNDPRDLYNVNDIIFSNLSNSASIKFADNSLIFQPKSLTNTKISEFDKTNTASYTKLEKSKITLPTLLIAPESSDINLKIPGITLTETNDGNPNDMLLQHTMGNLELKNIKVRPGYSYKLILRLHKPETSLGTVTNTSGTPALVIHTFRKGLGPNDNFPTTSEEIKTPTNYQFQTSADLDFGVTFDIHMVDNSFNIVINGESIFTNASTNTALDVELQSSYKTKDFSNIMFHDGNMYEHTLTNSINLTRAAKYQNNGAPNPAGTPDFLTAIYNMKGTAEKPLFRIVISAEGNVTVYGSKTSEGPLEPMVVRTDNETPTPYVPLKFTKKVTWHKNATNNIAITQTAYEKTFIKGTVRGYKTKK